MTDRTESILAELLEVQRQLLANQNLAIEQQRVALARQQRALRFVIALVVIVALSVLLPYAWQWVLYLLAE
ncbi:MAG TPA: hypothetical protein VFU02_22955 [Polyangiaceae bacterium]|jgi:hypothetical protein|nr:hypothetical protein [Polyangiaceae bacterium]HEU6449862.1 hypothetical protein [Gemmatimonadaceae bacterium]